MSDGGPFVRLSNPEGAHKYSDNVGLGFGDANDLLAKWNGTRMVVTPLADDSQLYIGDGTLSWDAYLFGQSAAHYISFDASASDFKFEDSVSLMFGTGAGAGPGNAGDVEIRFDATDLDVLAAADDLVIKFGNGTNSFDVWFYCDTAAKNVVIDASASNMTFDDVDLRLGDNDMVEFGDAQDVQVRWDATDLDVLAAADDSVIKFGNGTNSFDIWFYGNAATNTVVFDASANTHTYDDVDLRLGDNDLLEFGDSQDVQIRWDATDLDVLAAADDSVIKFGNGTASFDIWMYGNIATAYVLLDASASEFGFRGPVRFRAANTLSPRFELKWVAGQRGKPGINADIQNAAEGTREVTDPDFEILGTNGSSDDVTFYAEGGILIETDGADGDEVIILPHLDANQTAWAQVTWGTDRQTEWECDIQTAANITNTIIWAGLKLTNTKVTATDADQVFFRYEDDVNTGKWQAVDSIGGVDNAADSTVAVAINTRYHLKITIGSDRVARFYVNGVLVSTSAALTNTIDLIPYIGVSADGAAAAKSLRVHGQGIGREIG